MADPVNLDWTLAAADWPKSSWDLTGIDSVPKLNEWLVRVGMTPTEFKRLPVYRRNVRQMPWLRDLGKPPKQ